MCEAPKKPIIWGGHPADRIRVGTKLENDRSILIAEGIDTEGKFYCVWEPTNKGFYVLDQITLIDGTWRYAREYRCKDRNCILDTFNTLIKS